MDRCAGTDQCFIKQEVFGNRVRVDGQFTLPAGLTGLLDHPASHSRDLMRNHEGSVDDRAKAAQDYRVPVRARRPASRRAGSHDGKTGAQLSVPGSAKFTLVARQRFACVHTATDLYNARPPALRWGDFDELRLKSFDEIAQPFTQAAGQPVALLPAQTVSR